jgi:hypothetical protein
MTERFPAERVILFPNGVDYEHFHRERSLKDCPEDMKSIVTSGNPIIGYHGALAKWIDYDLLNALAEEMPDWNIVLIGWDYDGSLRALRTRSNITYLGLKTYNELPSYSVWFDVALIPFKTGDIAQSTSPIKLYEYMALNKPTVVTRDLIECHGYKSVFIARDKDDFIEKVEAALRSKDDPEFIRNADGEARANTWQNRAALLDATICKYS